VHFKRKLSGLATLVACTQLKINTSMVVANEANPALDSIWWQGKYADGAETSFLIAP
jgi:hypothetical protein